MTREELIKVAEDCLDFDTNCTGCPFRSKIPMCMDSLVKALIDELKKESPEEET